MEGVSSSFKGISRILEISLKSASGKFKWCFKEVSRSFNFQECFKKFQGYFKEDQRVFQGSFQLVSWAFERISKGI